ncbi:MAG TPA: 50S ribosomal protein L21 [Firmicutes bacterium]|jgi:large subunit ribosomal protein L21|nr:50S ribosomal protein L21 [Bacillota bacterium]HAW70569.1 50S ribosomal protein L21 [Bacillota bacterium]HAZ22976.1 50S ribosomal protein L21 [Bacillota bacterium]HBE07129.1 50S ribosomal protein L21 [Bacillota bacterium]HBG45076.1 50S ribosomal protein L21 [Bacillota bacterium]
MHAVIETGAKQFRVKEGDVIRVEKLAAEVGQTVGLEHVLLVSGEGETKIGRPYLEGAKVTATVLTQDKEPRVLSLRYKAKKNIRVRKGHRQPYTALRIEKIEY